jgi:hypothetical protein
MEMNEKNVIRLFNESGSYGVFNIFKNYKETPKDDLSKKIFNVMNDLEFKLYGEITIIKEISNIIMYHLNLEKLKK